MQILDNEEEEEETKSIYINNITYDRKNEAIIFHYKDNKGKMTIPLTPFIAAVLLDLLTKYIDSNFKEFMEILNK